MQIAILRMRVELKELMDTSNKISGQAFHHDSTEMRIKCIPKYLVKKFAQIIDTKSARSRLTIKIPSIVRISQM